MTGTIRRVTAALLLLCMMALLVPFSALAEETPPVYFDETKIGLTVWITSVTSADPGAEVDAYVSVNSKSNTGFETLVIRPDFSEGLSIVEGSATNGSVASTATLSGDFSFYTAGGTTSTGKLVSFKIKVSESAPTGTGIVNFSVVSVTDSSGTPQPNPVVTVTRKELPILAHDFTSIVTQPTCTEGGFTTYTCSRCGYSYTVDETSPTGHTWNAPGYTWSDDNASCTATRVCAKDASHVETETVQTSSRVTKEATATEGGEITYTADFTNTAFETQTKAVATEPTGGEVSPDDPQIVVESKTVETGSQFTVTLTMVNNPGVMSMRLTPVIPEGFTLVKTTVGDLLPDLTPGKNLLLNADEDVTEDGVLVTMTLSCDSSLAAGDYEISLVLRMACDIEENDIDYAIVPGVITVTDAPAILWGDANGDGAVNNKDIVRLKNYFANYDDETGLSTVDIFPGADANGDGAVNNKDIVRLKNFFANYDDETGLSSVILGPAA